MVKLNKIYTRTGDDGTTGLVTGERRPKYDPRIAACGSVDECNAAIGLARVALDGTDPTLDAMLTAIQNDLFDLGADLATPAPGPTAAETEAQNEPPGAALRIVAAQVERLEGEIDQLNAALSPLTSFVLPGGSAAAAHLHMARTICRRAERQMVALAARPDEHVSPPALHYINRLSDFLFVAARHANDKGAHDVLWVPGGNR